MRRHIVVWSRVGLAAVFAISALVSTSAARADDESQIQHGFEIITEIFPKGFTLNLAGKNRALVGLGSYLVNTTGCNDCHTYPNWATGHNPYMGELEQINAARYLAGGRPFGVGPNGPIVSANITPDKTGKPAGLNLREFLTVMYTGHNPHDPEGVILQVMPWPLYQWKTDRDLTAMYEYLRAIPSCQDTPPPDSANCKTK